MTPLFPKQESDLRIQKIRRNLEEHFSHLQGILVFSRINIYYLTGILANGVLWIPKDGEPVLMVRKGLERAKNESPLKHVYSYRSYIDLTEICANAQSPMPQKGPMGIDMTGITWSLAQVLQKKLPQYNFENTEQVFKRARSLKSTYELEKIREAGKRHALVLETILPHHMQNILRGESPKKSYLSGFISEIQSIAPRITQNTNILTEREISLMCMDMYFELDHGAILRMDNDEIFMGHVSCGDSGNVSCFGNVPMGYIGIHPAMPCMGSYKTWEKFSPLCVDLAFNYDAYCTDKTQSYFYGSEKDLPAQAQKAFACCQEVQHMAISEFKPGAIPSQMCKNAFDIAIKYGFGDTFMGYKTNQIPFLGHGIGLLIDEYPILAKGFDEPFEQGMVVAIEPKIGIEGFGMLGIENTLEITETGACNLTATHDNLLFIQD